MAGNIPWKNLDDEVVYEQSLERVLKESTLNFVVEFGKEEAKIAFDLSMEKTKGLLASDLPNERPVRWINIWAPNHQTSLIDLLAKHYSFSPRLCAIMKSDPNVRGQEHQHKRINEYSRSPQPSPKGDVELGMTSIETPRSNSSTDSADDSSHYAIAKRMVNYHSIDSSDHFLCIGANWLHGIRTPSNDDSTQRPLWSWLVLCGDNTVITLHEDTRPVSNIDALKSMRSNTSSILSQLSGHGHDPADPISIQTVRQTLNLDAAGAHPGLEGASNLFYYLFDDWRTVYLTINEYRRSIELLQTKILNGTKRTANTAADTDIIPSLHRLGREIRVSDHLYAGYKNLIQRILESKAPTANGPTTALSPSITEAPSKGVVLAQSARQRFERLSDRIQFMILNETVEFLAEKDALITTFFNINAQKDSEAAARLTRAATLLAKLSVLFLPVSLMTSYFSVQIPDLQSKYTGKDYWDAFAVVVSISFMCLFFFSRLLMWITEVLDECSKAASHWFWAVFERRARSRQRQQDSDAGKTE